MPETLYFEPRSEITLSRTRRLAKKHHQPHDTGGQSRNRNTGRPRIFGFLRHIVKFGTNPIDRVFNGCIYQFCDQNEQAEPNDHRAFQTAEIKVKGQTRRDHIGQSPLPEGFFCGPGGGPTLPAPYDGVFQAMVFGGNRILHSPTFERNFGALPR